MSRRALRDLFLAGTIIAGLVIAAAADAQETSPPDFSGMWGRNAFNFEPLAEGPRPLTNLSRMPNGSGNAAELVGDYNNPILKPEAAAVVKRLGEMSINGKVYPDPSNQCGTYAPPFTFAMQLGFQMLQKKDSITILYNQDDQVRHIRLNEALPVNPEPRPWGHSVGHYEGDTLVIETIAVKKTPLMMADRYGSPISEKLRVTERYRLIDGEAAKAAQEHQERTDGRVGGAPGAMPIDQDTSYKGLQIHVTVDDPEVFTAPWSGNITYRRVTRPWMEQICAEATGDYYEGAVAYLPRSDTPDF